MCYPTLVCKPNNQRSCQCVLTLLFPISRLCEPRLALSDKHSQGPLGRAHQRSSSKSTTPFITSGSRYTHRGSLSCLSPRRSTHFGSSSRGFRETYWHCQFFTVSRTLSNVHVRNDGAFIPTPAFQVAVYATAGDGHECLHGH